MASGGRTRQQDGSEFAALLRRVRAEAASPEASADCAELVALARDGGPESRDALADVLAETERPLWAREVASFALGCAGDRRAFETLIFLLNYRDPVRGATAAHALVRLGDPRTARAAAALATNELRTAYALHPVRLLVALRAPESVPTLVGVLSRLLERPVPHWPVALACVEGLGRIGDARARPVLQEAAHHHRLRAAAHAALARAGG
ncbi:HEAT repeat domain-containing protein [Streptomyces armeniacus]|uniref:HEAT repeat domain-containing protein n=1 Tax=Streptomyces armeniacus TaxID=83291 RepID=A0A345XI82_9ACTN|nr:HEAT repeat domain-containing protein [Streptomyces armeniacus]AXK31348.1 HEAT repeat domain-containing protein [Streptomyces armeniacus]